MKLIRKEVTITLFSLLIDVGIKFFPVEQKIMKA